jgi:hypothetical protein
MAIILFSTIVSLGIIGAACAISRAGEEMDSDQH